MDGSFVLLRTAICICIYYIKYVYNLSFVHILESAGRFYGFDLKGNSRQMMTDENGCRFEGQRNETLIYTGLLCSNALHLKRIIRLQAGAEIEGKGGEGGGRVSLNPTEITAIIY